MIRELEYVPTGWSGDGGNGGTDAAAMLMWTSVMKRGLAKPIPPIVEMNSLLTESKKQLHNFTTK